MNAGKGLMLPVPLSPSLSNENARLFITLSSTCVWVGVPDVHMNDCKQHDKQYEWETKGRISVCGRTEP
jgi:hypothetical protein